MRKSPLFTTGLAYLLLGVFFALERRLRQGQSAQSLETGAFDRKSTRLIGGAFLISLFVLLLTPILNRIQRGRSSIPSAGGWAGLGLMLGGIGLRAWANTILGAFYTRTLRVTEEQQLIQHGPYRLLRHPGYTGSIPLWIGAGLASMNRVSAATIAIVTASAYIYRIKAEEFMLEQTFGSAYRAYQRGTWRLFPLIY